MTRTLILGGTAWLGREIASRLVERGQDVTCLARGEAGGAPEGTTFVTADRRASDAYDAVRGQTWDEVVELSYDNDLVRSALDALAERAAHWTLVSSVSVYSRNDEPGADETADVVGADDLADYGQAKVAAEQASIAALDDRLLIARPGLIAGAGDPSDRFGYWVARFAAAEDEPVLVPEADGRFVQVVDVQDLAAWLAKAGPDGVVGRINVVGDEHLLSDVLAQAAAVAGFTGELVTADDVWLAEHHVHDWSGPHSLPLLLPRADTGFARRSNARYRAAGGRLRSLDDTLASSLADERSRGLDRDRRAGLSRPEERALLAELVVS